MIDTDRMSLEIRDFCYEPESGEPRCQPLKMLEDLLKWSPNEHTEHSRAAVCLQPQTSQPSGAPRTLLCHDMKGGYLEDRFVNGAKTCDAYRFFHWQYIDIFNYFSHSFITIPPPVWTNAAHKHGVQVMGTLITEWENGKLMCDEIFGSSATLGQVIDQMVKIAKYYGFEGWLINLENIIEEHLVPNVITFLKVLTDKMHAAIPNSVVIWYDSVTIHGKLDWQDQLNQLNKAFFDVCDGIYLNYAWKNKGLGSSAKIAEDVGRLHDVYVGVDVFGRSKLKGGFEMNETLEIVHKEKMSMALFAPGWVHETQGKEEFTKNEYRFWDNIKHCFLIHGPSSLPLVTSFCQGFGCRFYSDGKVTDDSPWYNLSKQELQPTYVTVPSTCNGSKCVKIHTDEAFSGGGCLQLAASSEIDQVTHFRLFSTCILLPAQLLVEYMYKVITGTGVSVFLELLVNCDGKCLNIVVKGPNETDSGHRGEVTDVPTKDYCSTESSVNGWTRRFCLIDTSRSNTLAGLSVCCWSTECKAYTVLCGEIKVMEHQ